MFNIRTLTMNDSFDFNIIFILRFVVAQANECCSGIHFDSLAGNTSGFGALQFVAG